MTDSDLDLLRSYAREKSEAAFATLVSRHVDLVYSAALRQVHSPQLAEEISQSVFSDLARNATQLKPETVLTAWLYQVTRRTAIDVVRRESRRQARERIAVEMAAMNITPDWPHIEPILDEGMDALDETDRAALLLRYFENKSLREVGVAFGTSEDAAQKRVSRAVDRLREFFAKRGVTAGAAGLVVVISANAVQAAPAGLAPTISAAATLASAAVKTSTAITAAKAIAMTTIQKAVLAAAITAVAFTVGTGAYIAHHQRAVPRLVMTAAGAFAPGSYISNADIRNLGYATPEDAIETINYVLVRGTFEDAQKGLSPEMQAAPGASNQAARNGFDAGQKMFAPLFRGLQIIAKKVISDDKVELKVRLDLDRVALKKLGHDAPPEFMVQPMTKAGDNWNLGGSTREYQAGWEDARTQIYAK